MQGSGHKKQNVKSKRTRRDSINHYAQDFYNLSGDVFNMEYPEAEKLILYDERGEVPAEYNDTIMEDLPIDVNSEDLDYFSGPTWQRNKIPSEWKNEFFKNSTPILSSYDSLVTLLWIFKMHQIFGLLINRQIN